MAPSTIAQESPVASTSLLRHLSHRQILTVLTGLMTGMLLAALDQTVVATAMPTIVAELGGLSRLSWVVTAVCLRRPSPRRCSMARSVTSSGASTSSRLPSRHFFAGSALAGLSQSMLQLILFRAFQGLGAGGLMVTAQAIIADIVSPRERGRYQGYMGAVSWRRVDSRATGRRFPHGPSPWRWASTSMSPWASRRSSSRRRLRPAPKEAGGQTGSVRRLRRHPCCLGAAVTCVVQAHDMGRGHLAARRSPPIEGPGLGSCGSASRAGSWSSIRAAEPLISPSLFRIGTFNIGLGDELHHRVRHVRRSRFCFVFLQVASGTMRDELRAVAAAVHARPVR